MKKNVKNALVIVLALVLVIVVGKYSADHRLKATDGEENVVTEVPETVTEATERVEEIIIESALVEISTEELVTEETVEAITEEVTEVETEEVAETEFETEETETEEETEIDTSNCNIEVTSNVEHSDDLTEGTKITLSATLTGFENIEYTLQWQRSLDGESWEDISGANATKYTFTLNDETGRYYWKVVAITD